MKRFLLITLIAMLALGAFFAWIVFGPATARKGTVRIQRNSTMPQVRQVLKDSLQFRNTWFFETLAGWMRYKEVRPVRFEMAKGSSLFELVKALKQHARQTVNVVILPGHDRRQLARQISRQLDLSAAELDSCLQDSAFLAAFGVNPRNFHRIVLPNTYNLYYAAGAREVFAQFSKYATEYWKKKDLRPGQADTLLTLASIVEKETTHTEEKARVAGVYLNRLRIGMKLQADPTVNFALDEWRALSYDDLQVASPYNTYAHAGLPPGPICIPGPASVKAVLEPENHSFLYFVAKGDGSGVHRFSADFNGHLANIALRKKELAAGK
jgi:UPF0755 protein